MEEKIVLLLLLTFVIFLSGCINQPQNGGQKNYKNDIITIEHYAVTDAEPYAKSSTSIDFDIKNNGDKTLDEVNVNFFDIICGDSESGFKATVICDEKTETGRECTFKDVEPFEERHVVLDITTPDVSILTSCPFRFSVSYNYSGARDITMPIIDGVTIMEPLGKFDPGTPTYGPIVLDIEAPIGKTTKTDSQEIIEHWGIIGKPFEVTMKFRYASDVPVPSSEPVNISKDNIKLVNLTGVSIAKIDGNPLYCDFEENLLSKKDVIVTDKSEDSGSLICNFQSDSSEPEVDAHVGVIFSYSYKFIVDEESIKVKPIS